MSPLHFQPLRSELYSFSELFRGFSARRPRSYAATADFAIYRQYVAAGRFAPTDYFMAMMEALHDNSIREATQDFLQWLPAGKAIAFMGGHDLPRSSGVYAQVAVLARELALKGYLPISGGGPGAMEATHLGALHRHEAPASLAQSLAELARVPRLPRGLPGIVSPAGKPDWRVVAGAHAWLLPAVRIRERIRNPGVSLAVPTWLYGHEPTTALATHVAKYFQNSIREDRLLSIATHGVIYVEGHAGTVQEIFQDAALNCYRILGGFSPMIFLGRRQWTRQLPVIAVLRSLFEREDFKRYVLVTDDPSAVLPFLGKFRPGETPAERVDRLKPARRRK